MERRFVTFLLLAFGILMLNQALNVWFNPLPPPQAAADREPDDQESDVQDDDAPDAAAKAEEADPHAPAGEDPADGPDAEPIVAAAPPVPLQLVPLQLVTLGSVDAESGYRMGITLTNRGAAVVRLELSNPQFRDTEDASGYLGHLAATDAPGDGALVDGALVNVVVPGTPAAQAGIMADDVITSIGVTAISTAADLLDALRQTKPHRSVELTYRRGQALPKSVTAQLRRRPLEVMRPEREHLEIRGETVPQNFPDPASFLTTLEQIGEQKISDDAAELKGVDLTLANWEIIEQDETHVTFRRVLSAQKLEVLKTYRLTKAAPPGWQDGPASATPGYDFDLEIEIRNLADVQIDVAYRQDGPTGLPTEGWWYGYKIGRDWGGVGVRDMFVQFVNAEPKLIGASTIAEQEKEDVEFIGVPLLLPPLLYAGIDAKYISAVMIPCKAEITEQWFEKVKAVRIGPEPDPKVDNVTLINSTCRLISRVHTLEPAGGEPLRQSYQIFAGPKRSDIISQYGQPVAQAVKRHSLESLVYYGWPIWAGVAKLMTLILHMLYSVVGNYGLAIVLLTVMVRGCMFPLSKKQALNMIKMQELQPEIKKIADKYKKDMEKRTRAQQELFRKHNYHPMGGCLVMFLQLPIFLGLYRALMIDIELRDAPLISESVPWCSNLAAPDMLYDWSGFMPDFITGATGLLGLGPYLNVLPLVTVGLFILQQKMFMPPPTDDQTAMQQKIMKYMMVFMGLIFYKVASGLCLYFIVSSLWGICERKLLPKPPKRDAAAQATKPSASGSSNSSNGHSGKKSAKRAKQPRK